MLIPGILNLLLFKYFPMWGIIISFQQFHPAMGIAGSKWVGFKHFVDFVNDPYFYRIIRNTLVLGALTIIFSFPAPIIFALLLVFPYLPGAKSPAIRGFSIFVGILVSLGSTSAVANVIAGIAITYMRAFQNGDRVRIADTIGDVVEKSLLVTRIRTPKNVVISIPNSILANSMIINESAPEPRFRIRIDIGVAYGSDLRKIEKILLKVAEENETLAKEPEPRVRVRAFADSSINFQLLVWVQDPSHKGLQTHNLLKATYKAFEKEGITIPFPQRDVHLVTAKQEKQDMPESDSPLTSS